MCTGKCAKCIGVTLYPLAAISILCNILLFFPDWSTRYMKEERVTAEVQYMGGLIGGGVMVSAEIRAAHGGWLGVDGGSMCNGWAGKKSSQSKEVLELGQVLDSGVRKRKIKYSTSETRLAEALDNICEGILEYSVHAERPGSLRYAKNLVHKGVKVELGIPYELWDEPSVEVSDMKKQTMLEQYEEVVEGWYLHHQDQRLESFLCEKHVLQGTELECLREEWKGDTGKKRASEGRSEKKRRKETEEEEEERREEQSGGGAAGHDAGEL
ncbi:Protein canopy 4 [Acipenser ruthenus]|uniref:Protein canopy 4 n=1 Tax=Acipenser ruthenus TaxID=7906 RepID=A0A444UY55_ACIRT|nr:Protein canopy 4 [Acipenser ruthenus]